MPALYPLSATLAPPHVNMKLDPFHLWLGYLGLILLLYLGLLQLPATVRATTRQFSFQRLVDRGGNRTATAAPYLVPAFRPGLAGWAFGSRRENGAA